MSDNSFADVPNAERATLESLRHQLAERDRMLAERDEAVRELRTEVMEQHRLHVAMVEQIQKEARHTLADRESYFSALMNRRDAERRAAEEGRISSLLERLEVSQEYLGKGLIDELRRSFAPLNTYAQRLLIREEMKSLCEEEASLRQVQLIAEEESEWQASTLSVRRDELSNRFLLRRERRDILATWVTAQEEAHRHYVVYPEMRDRYKQLRYAFYDGLFNISPSTVLSVRPLAPMPAAAGGHADIAPPVEVWEEAGHLIAADANRGDDGDGAAAVAIEAEANPPQPQREGRGDNHEEERADRRWRDDQRYVQDPDRKEMTFVGGGVLFHIRTREHPLPHAEAPLNDNNEEQPQQHRPPRDGDNGQANRNEAAVQEAAAGENHHGNDIADRHARPALPARPILLDRIEVVFDEPMRTPEQLEDADPFTLEDNLFDVHVELWLKKGSFLVSEREKEAYIAQNMRRHPRAQRAGRGLHPVVRDRAEHHDGDEDPEVHLDVGGDLAWIPNANRDVVVDHDGHDRDADRNDHRQEEDEEYAFRLRSLARQFESGQKRVHRTRNLSLPNDATIVQEAEKWVKLHSSVEPRVGKNETFIIPANRAILEADTEYSIFIRVVNKKILNFVKRVIHKCAPAEGDPAGAVTFQEETNPDKFFYRPDLYVRHDDHVSISGCRWNVRNADCFFKLAPANDDVFYGQIVYHVL